MRNYVLGIIVNNKDLISIVISIIAAMIAYCSWKESKIVRIESGQAFLSISLIQISGKIYAILQNIGNTYAYDIEIKNTDESIELFCEKLNGIIDTHLFLNKLNSDDLEQEDALNIIEYQCNEISCFIEDLHDSPQYRDEVSRRIVRDLNDLCYATLILNAYKNGYTNVSEKLAWEVSQLRQSKKL